MAKNKLFVLTALIILTVAASGCVTFKTDESQDTTNRGVFKSVNKGETWTQKVLVPNVSGRPASIGGVNVNNLIFDPSDNKAIYWGSIGNGLLYSYDGAESWNLASALGKATINDIAVDPNAKCVIYAAIENKVYKSTDCSRNWSQSYFGSDLKIGIKTVAVDFLNSSIVYFGASDGSIVKSADGGDTWRKTDKLNGEISSLEISPNDSRIIFAAAGKKEIFKSTDSGETWSDLGESLKEFKNFIDIRDFKFSLSASNHIFLASGKALFKTEDNGGSWTELKLLDSAKTSDINALAIGPTDEKEIYYLTNTAFLRSIDGGVNWTSKKLPTAAAGVSLLIDPKNPSIIYMGAKGASK